MENVKKNLRSVLLSKVGGVPLKNVERDYKNLVGERLNWREFGYGSFEAFLNAIPDVVKVAFRKDAMHAFGIAENMSYINPTARKAQFKETQPMNGTCSDTGNVTVYIGHLPLKMTEETLKSFLSAYLVLRITTVKHHNSTSAWVVTTRDAADRMCSELNRKRCDDHTLKVELAHKQDAAKKRDFPARPSARGPSCQSTAPSINSDGDSSSLRTQFSKNNAVNESLTSADTWSGCNGAGEPKLHRGFSAEPYQRQSPQPEIANSVSASALGATSCNYDSVQPSRTLGLKDSTSGSAVVQVFSHAEFEEDDSDFLWNGSGEPPPLIAGGDWEEEFDQRTSSKRFNGQRGYSNQTRDEPPPLFSRNDSEKLRQKDEMSSSSSLPSNSGLKNEQLDYTTYEGETFNLYVKKIPVGTTLEELYGLFKNAVKIVGLSRQSCFAVFQTIEEVEDASRRSWTIQGAPIVVDVASKHKQFCSDRLIQPTEDEAHILDLSTGFENLTCTVGRNNERKVQLCAEKSPIDSETDVPWTQTTDNLNTRENRQQRSLPIANMPPLVSRADHTKSRVHVQPAADYMVPPLLSMEELAKIRENLLSQKPGGRPCNSETIDQDFPTSTCDGANSNRPYNALNPQEDLQSAARKTESSRQFHEFSDFDGDCQTANRNSVRSNSRQYLPKSSEALPSARLGNSSEIRNGSNNFAEKVMPALKQHDRSDFCAKFQSSADHGERGDVDRHDCMSSLNSQLPSAATSSQGASSVSPLKPIPDEMRLKELQRMLMDTFPGDTLPTSYLLPDVVHIIIICAVSGFENSFFWGQLASDDFGPELTKMYDLIPRIEEISSSLTVASAALRRGATKYGDDWCRVWIKLRGETTSTVFFIDFGNFETVSNDSIYELPEEFWKVRPTALPFRSLDPGKFNISQHINKRVAAKVNKKCQRGCIFEIYDLQAQS